MWIVYILFSTKHKKTYIGSTDNFKRRLLQHNQGLVTSTKLYIPWLPIYCEFYPNENSARARERALKTSTGRRYLKKIINNIINEWSGSSVG